MYAHSPGGKNYLLVWQRKGHIRYPFGFVPDIQFRLRGLHRLVNVNDIRIYIYFNILTGLVLFNSRFWDQKHTVPS